MAKDKNPVIIFLVTFLFILGMEMMVFGLVKIAVPVWALVLIAIVISAAIVIKLRPAATRETPAENQQTGASTKRNYLGILPILIVIALIVLAGWWLNNATSDTPNKTFSGKTLLQYMSGNCNAREDDSVACTGPWTLNLPGDQEISWMRIWQKRGRNVLTRDMKVSSGKWRIDFSQQYLTCSTPLQSTPTPRYKAAIFYEGISDFACDGTGGVEAPTEENTITQEPPVYIGMPWMFWDPNKDSPEVFVGEYKVSHGTVRTDRIFKFGLPLEIKYGLSAETVIDRIEIKTK